MKVAPRRSYIGPRGNYKFRRSVSTPTASLAASLAARIVSPGISRASGSHLGLEGSSSIHRVMESNRFRAFVVRGALPVRDKCESSRDYQEIRPSAVLRTRSRVDELVDSARRADYAGGEPRAACVSSALVPARVCAPCV